MKNIFNDSSIGAIIHPVISNEVDNKIVTHRTHAENRWNFIYNQREVFLICENN